MLHRGSCPSCHETLVWTDVPPAAGTCGKCGLEFLVTVPEGVQESIEVEVLPRVASRPSWLEAHGLRRPARIALAVALAFVLAAFLLGVAYLFAPESSTTEILTIAFVIVVGIALIVFLILGMALVSAFAIRRGTRLQTGSSLWSSTRAVWAGMGTLFAASVVEAGVRWLFEESGPSLGTIVIVINVAGCVLAGWITARLAPEAPFRHATGVVLILSVLAVWIVLVLPGFDGGPRRPVQELALATLTNVVPLFLGAWLGRRPSLRLA